MHSSEPIPDFVLGTDEWTILWTDSSSPILPAPLKSGPWAAGGGHYPVARKRKDGTVFPSFNDALNARDVDAMMQWMTPNCIFENTYRLCKHLTYFMFFRQKYN
jgi:hypothetical protein